MIVPRKRSNLICGCGGIGRRARLRILCSQDMQVRVLSTAPAKPCDYYNHRVFSYHFAGIKAEWQTRKHRKQSKNLKKTLLHFAIFSVLINRRGNWSAHRPDRPKRNRNTKRYTHALKARERTVF